MRALKLLPLPALLLLCRSVSRGQDQTTLNGNWHLAGSWDHPSSHVRVFLSLGIEGNNIFGSGDIWTSCEGGGAVPVRLEGDATDPTLNKLRATLSYPSKDFAAAGFLSPR